MFFQAVKFLKTMTNGVYIRKFCFKSNEKDINSFKVTICGAAGKIGQPLSLFVHLSRIIDSLALHDVSSDCCSVGLDLSYINLECVVKSYSGKGLLKEALEGSNIVLCAASLPTPSGLSIVEMFPYNAKIVTEICEAIADVCPKALLVVCTGPVNSMVPLACEVMKRNNRYDPKKIVGLTSLDVIRCNAIANKMKGLSLKEMETIVPVVGGSSPLTLVPVLSQSRPAVKFNQEEACLITENLRKADDEVNSCGGTASLSTAYSAAAFTVALCRALKGEECIQECCFVPTDNWLGMGYIAAPVRFGKNGIEEVVTLSLDPYEQDLLEQSKKYLKEDITRGTCFARKNETGDAICCG